MKRLVIAAASAFLALASAHAQQQASPLYGELGYSFLRHDSGLGFRTNPQALRGIVGYNVHPNLAVEGMAALGTSDDSDNGFTSKMRHQIGVFAKPKYAFDNFEVFGRVGWVQSRLRTTSAAGTVNESGSDFAWGLGANYNINPKMYVGVDYMRTFDKGNSKVDGVTIGVGYRF
ncbi:MAG TPA: porin family protein [Ramlibacter sp.]|uniref:porin family protein n=1 Tax=Ramlibacter sp. TaxID=1917967 RepID=UPI002ED09B45